MYNNLPKMPNHRNLIDKFSMYMAVENKYSRLTIQWKTEPHLQRNIELYKTKHPKFTSFNEHNNTRELVQFWIDMALNDLPHKEEWEPENRVQKAWEHLSLYCEESCYRAAVQVWKEDTSKCWEEYVFFARCLIYDSNKFKHILAKYNCKNSSLNTYVTEVLTKTIKDEAVVAKFSKWRLLCKKSDKELKEALARDGKCEPEISCFLFARKYFKQVYQINKVKNPAKKTGQKWPEPDSDDFAEAARYYNTEKLLSCVPHEVSVSSNITAEQLNASMEICIAALQNYPKSITPRFSLEVLQEAGREIESREILKIEAESAEQQASLVNRTEAALQQELLSLKPDQQEILLLYYGLGLNQKEIADKFSVTQGAIAHRLRTIEKKLGTTIYGLSQPPEWVTRYVATWLEYNYQAPLKSDLIHAALVEAIKKLEPQDQEVLRLSYGQKLDEQAIFNQLSINLPEVTEIIRKTQAKLEAVVLKQIDSMVCKYLQYWLSKKYKSVMVGMVGNAHPTLKKSKIPIMR